MELRFNQTAIQTNEDGSMTVSGYVNKTETKSKMLGRNQKFKEVIKRGAWQRAIDKAEEIHFLAEHDKSKILASTRNGSLELREDDQGLYMEATISPTSWGKDYHQLIKDGILQNMSFGFRSVKDAWRNMGSHFERTVNELDLFEVSVVRDPAYASSSICARGIDLVEDIEIPNIQEVKEVKDMNKKALIELRNELLEESQTLETRGLTNDLEYEQLKSRIKDIDMQLKKYEAKEVRNNMIDILNGADEKIDEKRGFEAFLKSHFNSEEVRAITTSAVPGQLVVPTSIADEIVKKLEEVAPLFSLSKKFPSVSGRLDVLKETDIGGAQWLDEMENATVQDFAMEKVTLEQKRLTAAVELSQNMINDAGFDIVAYVVDLVAQRIANALNRAIINGNGVKQPQGFLTATLPSDSNVTTAAIGEIDTDDILGLFNSMNPQLVEGAVFIMNRSTFNTVSKLKDGNNNYYLVDMKNGNGYKYYTVLGLPVQISDVMPDILTGNKAIALVNLGRAYGTLVKKGIEVKHISGDTQQALRGSQLIVADMYLDGKVINDQAVKLLKIK
ncbi:phage major capsid protein [Peribacillus frigoritolerans]|uniref:phage major capsid protein n=1 Tax=Peribacillus frigoritolerans TaxID=450367 RepID=UPI002226E715|nr:phage major capsid protein [Peribacillus frigoritolerans]UYZ01778.1 phage major capsid protein [Peribacillus frigoritolerans]